MMSQDRDVSSSQASQPKREEAAIAGASPRLPSVSLPKGGGAIRGLGEKFGVNPATGTGSLTVPVASSPGRSGFGPQLSLSYDSGSGNGPFGLGWNLSLPAITRKTDKGLPRYRDADESDVFLLSGAEDLAPILDSSQNRVSFSRTLHNIDYRIYLYRPRIEGVFARIERWTRTDSGVSHWRTITRDNVTTLFGIDDSSRIRDPNDERRIFSYLIALTFDDKGNATRYQYATDDLAGINRTIAHEANRTDADRQTQRYLKSIHYGNATPYFPDWSESGSPTPLPATWHFQIVFDYGDHRAEAPTPVRDPAVDPTWPVRPDPWSVFRAGFEVRTYRRCERVLLFHQFLDRAEFAEPYLVRSTDFHYSDETTPADSRNPIYTFIESVRQTGYRRRAVGYDQRSTPPLEFFYSQPELQPEVLILTESDSRENLPEGLGGSNYQWVDLDGEGLSGILTNQDGGWSYKRNHSPINRVHLPNGKIVMRASFGPSEQILSLTVPFAPGQGQQLLDLTGEGRPDLVAFDAPVPGYFARTIEEIWEPLKTFTSLPRLNWSEPNLKFVDLTGDGRADVLITEDDLYTFYRSLGVEGFGEAEQVASSWDEERGPRVVFADGTQTVSLADLTGDGLSDIVRVRNGEVCYWPNLGYGHFGRKVSMDNAPRFASEEQFDPRRIHFADVDGSGTTDLLYVGFDGVQVCFNRSGNSWAEPHVLAVFPGADSPGSIQVTDLLGNGTACLVWSSPLPGEAYAPLRYVDLMGSQKPHLMVQTRNNLGAETRVSYAPSTRFYLEDKRAGRPWLTRLPFPVHVVDRLEIYDWIGRSRFVTRYAYHHGYFDGEEREFRGFGMVEQWDTETHRDDTLFPALETSNEDNASFVPPVRTRTWFHTGAFTEAGSVSKQYAQEYWTEPALRGDSPAALTAREALLLPDTVLDGDFDADEMREAYRALKGSTLRIEVYSDDQSLHQENPYTVTEQNLVVRRLQRHGPNQHAVFLTTARETIVYHYERQADDPRVAHDVTLEADDFGNVLRSVSVGYPRRTGHPEPEPQLSANFRAMLDHDQQRLHIGATENRFTDPVNEITDAFAIDSYRGRLTSETITAELSGIAPTTSRFSFQELDGHWTTLWDASHDIPYEEVSTPDVEGVGTAIGPGRRIVGRSRTRYRSNDLTTLLPLGVAESRAMTGESYRLALTAGLVTRVFGARVTDAILIEGGYLRPAGETDWWIPSGRVFYSPNDADTPDLELPEARAHFFQPRRATDPFGAVNRITYDPYDLLPVSTTNAVGNVTLAANDYRVLLPFRSTDPNGNHNEVAFDCLGRVSGMAVNGKAGEGDSLIGFTADLSDVDIQAAIDAPLASPNTLLANATSRIIYDQFAFFRTRDQATPAAPTVYVLTRETHVSDLAPAQATVINHVLSYSDGFGREVQNKAQAETGPVGNVNNVSPRWVGSGWTIYNNKGKPARKFEPFFSQTHRFEFNRQAGVSSVLFYDSVERAVATVHADNTFEKTVFSAWREETWDANDTVLISDPRTDPDVGNFFRRLFGPAAGAFVSWHDLRIGGLFGDGAEQRAANQDAAQKAAAHANTPAVAHFDSLGRTCLTIQDNGINLGVAQRYASRTAVDTESKPLCVFDARERHLMEFCLREPLSGGGGFRYVAGYDVAGKTLYQNAMDSGEQRTLHTVLGNPLRTWDARGTTFRFRYDALHRATHVFATRSGSGEVLLERSVYGDKHPDATRNLKGKLFRHYDAAGFSSNDRYDFKGNLIENGRQLAVSYRRTTDWSVINTITDSPALAVAALDADTATLLDSNNAFTTSSRFDALNRAIQIVLPHTPTGSPSIIQSRYNEAKLLNSVDVWIREATVPTALHDPATADVPSVTNIDYNARGQRTEIAFGNGTITNSSYDSETFRITSITTTRPNTFAADARIVQALSYQYDPAGNITRARDDADTNNQVFFNNQRVEPSADYTYDPLYRLTIATGREHLGRTGPSLNAALQANHDDSFRTHVGPGARRLNPGDGRAMGNYRERYEYDSVGNLLQMIHQVPSGGWTRHYSYDEPSRITAGERSNRLSATSEPGDDPLGPYSARYAYDEHGNVTKMPHLPGMTWDVRDHLQSTTRQVFAGGTPETTYYVYDANGDRVRKVTDSQADAGNTPNRTSERIYLGAFEIYREYDGGGTLAKERETVHVMLDHRRVAIIETRTAGADVAPPQLIRYQHSNCVGSATVELDGQSNIISYEEYFPYGSTSYQAMGSGTETPKRYRYTGKERDEESDLSYHGARYYVPWLGRWTACDPIGLKDGPNVYMYVSGNPVAMSDPSGMWGWREVAVIAAVVVVGTIVTVATAGVAGPIIAGAVASVGLTGAAATVTTGVVVGAVAGAVGGAAAGAAGETTRQTVHSRALGLGNESFSGGRIARAAGRGAVEGAAIGAAVGGVAAFAATAAGGAALAAVGRVGGRVVPGIVRQGAGALGRGAVAVARTVARAPGVRQAVAATGRGLRSLHTAAENLGTRAATRLFPRTPGGSAAAVEGASASVRPSAPPAEAEVAATSSTPAAPSTPGSPAGAAAGEAGSGAERLPDMVYRSPRAEPLPGTPNPNAARTPGEHVWGGDHLPGSPYESWTSDRAVAEEFAARPGRLPVEELDLNSIDPSRIGADLRTPAGRAAAAAQETEEHLKNVLLHNLDNEVVIRRP